MWLSTEHVIFELKPTITNKFSIIRLFLDTILAFSVAECYTWRVQREIIVIYRWHFRSLGILEYSLNHNTIAPKIVLFNLNFDSPLSHRYTIIIDFENTFQRLLIFVVLNHKQQESVQNLWFTHNSFVSESVDCEFINY